MNTTDEPPPEKRRYPWLRFFFALLGSLFITTVGLPNTPQAVVDNSTNPPTVHIETSSLNIAIVLALGLIPLACVAVGIRRWVGLEIAGWLLLVALVVAIVARG